MPASVLYEFLAAAAGEVQERVLRLAGAVVDAVRADVRDVAEADLLGREQDARAAGGRDAAEVDRLRVERLGGGHDRDVVLGGLGGRVVLDDGAAARP